MQLIHDRALAGTLVLVVGPSGAGKDTLISEAKWRLAYDPRFVFPQRLITRPTAPGAELHAPIGQAEFDAIEEVGGFLLAWRSHSLRYGIPRQVIHPLAKGRTVVVNVSRTVIGRAEALVENVAVLHVTASKETLVRRLAERGREPFDELQARIAREVDVDTVRAPVIGISNDGAIEDSAAAFTAALIRLTERAQVQTAR